MKTIYCLAVGLTALGLSAGSATAQVRGSYMQSCTQITQDGPLLTAACRDRNGQMRTARIDTRNCRGDIGNNNGALVCGGGGGRAAPPPRGGYEDRRGERFDGRYEDRRRRFDDDEPPRRRRYDERY